MNHQIMLRGEWVVKAPVGDVFGVMTDFEKFPARFPKVAEAVRIVKREGNHLEIEATVRSFGRLFPVFMKTEILPGKGFVSDNESPKFGTSGHEELLLSERPEGTVIDYTYQVSIHKPWLRLVATPLIKWYSMKFWEKAVIWKLREMLENKGSNIVPDSDRQSTFMIEKPHNVTEEVWNFLKEGFSEIPSEELPRLLTDLGYEFHTSDSPDQMMEAVTEKPAALLCRLGLLDHPDLMKGMILGIIPDKDLGIELEYVFSEASVQSLKSNEEFIFLDRLGGPERDIAITKKGIAENMLRHCSIDYLE